MKYVFSIIFCSILLVNCQKSDEYEIFFPEQNTLRIDISTPNTILNVNEVPKLTATVTNISSEDIYLYNDYNYRFFPIISLSIFKTGSDTSLGCLVWAISPKKYSLKKEHFVLLHRGEEFPLFENSNELSSNYSCVFQNPGKYKLSVKLNYDNHNLSAWTTENNYDSTLLNMFELIPKEKCISNEINFIIK